MKFKKSIALVLSGVFSLLAVAPTYVYADGGVSETSKLSLKSQASSIAHSKVFLSCVDDLFEKPEMYEIEDDLCNAYIGRPYTVYNYNEHGSLTEDTTELIYPLVNDGSILAEIVVIDLGEDGLYYSVSKGNADVLNKLLSENSGVALVSDKKGNFAVVNESGDYHVLNCTGDRLPFIDANISDIQMNVSTVGLNESYLSSVDIDALSVDSTMTVGNVLSNYPKYYNSYPWALVILSMGRYLNQPVYVSEQIVARYQTMYGTLPSNNYVSHARVAALIDDLFTDYSASSTTYTGRLSKTEIQDNIDNGLPAYLFCQTSSGVCYDFALMGYGYSLVNEYGNTYDAIYAMMPSNSQYVKGIYNSYGAVFIYSSTDDQMYNWYDTVSLVG